MIRSWTAASLLALAMTTGCATHGSSHDGESSDSVQMDLDIAPGVKINGASYAITGPGGFSRSGTVNVSQSTKLSVIVGGLPTGSGFTITITATSVDGGTTCAGSATFDVAAHASNPVTVHLTCHEAPRTGSALVNGNLNVCPVIDGVSVTPSEVLVGGTVSLSATAHDTDAAPSALTYTWTASSGSLSSTTSPSPTFTCTKAGTATLTLTVSDGDATPGCAATETTTVTCTGLFSADCQQCLTTNCSDVVTGCDSLTDTALAGPAQGVSKAQLCNETLACVVASHCGTDDLSSCYCGTAATDSCIDDGAANGPCKTAFERAFEAVMPLDVPVRFSDATFAGGAAMTLMQCASDNCTGCL
jgi:hypothetical protein